MNNRVGLGTFPLTTISKEEAKNIVRQFMDSGGYYIDTASVYGFGNIESMLGEVLGEFDRNQYFLIDKCGYIDVEGKSFRTVKNSGKYDDVIRECDRSLKRLNLDYLDLYFLHKPDRHAPYDETMGALKKLQNDGKIKEIGVSNVSLDQLRGYNYGGDVKYIQNRFSLLNQSIDKEYEDYLLSNKISLIPYNVIDRGLLTGMPNRLTICRWSEEDLNKLREWVKIKLEPLANKIGITLAQLSIAWALNQKYVDFVLVGVTNPEYLSLDLKANNMLLSPDIMREIKDILSLIIKA